MLCTDNTHQLNLLQINDNLLKIQLINRIKVMVCKIMTERKVVYKVGIM